MKRLLLILLMLIPISALAGNGRADDSKKFNIGIEWGYVASFHYGIHYNFFSQEGYRVDQNYNRISYKSNAEVYLHLDCNLNRDMILSLYAGYSGVRDFGDIIPVSLRITRMLNQNSKGDRWLVFLDAGSGICLKKNPQEIVCGKIGTGYRIALSRDSSLMLLFAYRMTLTHPEIIYDDYKVPSNMINRNNAYVSALSMGISLSF